MYLNLDKAIQLIEFYQRKEVNKTIELIGDGIEISKLIDLSIKEKFISIYPIMDKLVEFDLAYKTRKGYDKYIYLNRFHIRHIDKTMLKFNVW